VNERHERVGPPRMIDIARLAGVSRMAVSAVLMGTGQGRIAVSPAKAERIREIANRLGYRPNPAARQLAGQRSGVIAMVAKDWRNYLTQGALSRLHEVAETHGLHVLTAREEPSQEPLQRLLRDLQFGWIDGLIYLAYENESHWPKVAELLAGVSRAIVAVGAVTAPGVSAVSSDVRLAAEDSVRHLFSRGYSRLCIVTEELATPSILSRVQGYREAASELGIPIPDTSLLVETKGWLIGSPDFHPHFDALARKIREQHKADAVLCDSDFTASGLAQAFRRQHLRIPDDIALLGWGNLHFSALIDPPLTTVDYNLPELFSRIVTRLQQTFAAPNETSDDAIEKIPNRLIVRRST